MRRRDRSRSRAPISRSDGGASLPEALALSPTAVARSADSSLRLRHCAIAPQPGAVPALSTAVDAALVGFVGVIVGLIIGSGFTFWSTRRSELEKAVIACSILSEELRALQADDASRISRERLEEAWAEHRSALTCEMRPDDFDALAVAIRRAVVGASPIPARLDEALRELTRLFWQEHQALILIPFINYVRGNVLTARVHEVLAKRLPGTS